MRNFGKPTVSLDLRYVSLFLGRLDRFEGRLLLRRHGAAGDFGLRCRAEFRRRALKNARLGNAVEARPHLCHKIGVGQRDDRPVVHLALGLDVLERRDLAPVEPGQFLLLVAGAVGDHGTGRSGRRLGRQLGGGHGRARFGLAAGGRGGGRRLGAALGDLVGDVLVAVEAHAGELALADQTDQQLHQAAGERRVTADRSLPGALALGALHCKCQVRSRSEQARGAPELLSSRVRGSSAAAAPTRGALSVNAFRNCIS